MASIALHGNPLTTTGSLPATGTAAPDFSLTNTSLKEVSLADFSGKKVVLNIFPSIDTSVCAASVRFFNQAVSNLDNAVVLCVSKDLPFAHKRFCGAEGLENVHSLSSFKDNSFEEGYNVTMNSGPLNGLFSRAVVVIDENGTVIHSEQVQDISSEPNYDAALAVL